MDGALHRRLWIADHAPMSYRQQRRLERQQFACALQSQPFMPGSERRQGEEPFERSRNGNAALRLDGIACAQAYLRLRRIKALITGQKTRVSLADSNLDIRQGVMERVE